MRTRRIGRLAFFACCMAVSALAGCGGGAPAAAPAFGARTIALEPGGGVAAFPLVGGYTASFAYSANDANGATVELTTATAPARTATVPGEFAPRAYSSRRSPSH